LIVNYGVGGNIDTEARILARHLPKHIPGSPTIKQLIKASSHLTDIGF
jgi:hypothetical protein